MAAIGVAGTARLLSYISVMSRMWAALKKKIPFFILTPTVDAYGNCAEEIYWGLVRARRENKKVIFIFVWDLFGPFVFSKKRLGVNTTLKRCVSPFRLANESNVFVIVLTLIVTIIYSLIRLMGLLGLKCFRLVTELINSAWVEPNVVNVFRRWSMVKPSIGRKSTWPILQTNSPYGNQNNPWVQAINSPLKIDMSVHDLHVGEKFAYRMGLPTGVDFVCLHVRETGFYGAKEGRGKTTRNGNIESYFDAIRYLTSMGYWVVRLGDKTMTKLPNFDCVIDYPFTPVKNYLMDIWLIRNCEFYLGQDSGPTIAAFLFQKPIIMANIVDVCCGFPFRKGELGILKHVYSRTESRYLSVTEIVQRCLNSHNNFINDPDTAYVDNSSEEIKSLVQEFVEKMQEGDSKYEYSNLQRMVSRQRELFNQNVEWIKPFSESQKRRFLATVSALNGTISEEYLRHNAQDDLLNSRSPG